MRSTWRTPHWKIFLSRVKRMSSRPGRKSTSAPPTTLIAVSPEITGQVVGATKHTCRRGEPSRAARGTWGRAMAASGGADKDSRANVLLIDTFEALGGFLDAGVRAHPALLLG